VDAYGVGTQLVVGSGAPTASMVYKLVARAAEVGRGAPLVPVVKKSPGKVNHGGLKYAYRRLDADGVAAAEVVGSGEPAEALTASGRSLIVPLVVDGERVGSQSLDEARELHRRSLAELPVSATELSRGDAVIPTVYEDV
jgi:nicotinate phosphoribosyltransferase